MSTINEFRLSSSLELRLKIWGIATLLSIPRNVNIICQSGVRFTKSFKPSDRQAALLYVCRESRSKTLEIYKPLL
ncbi:hypothetical protein G7Y89_g7400 [Cudoniella acicularis]|uniref:2EXR domain-containing protein n=1 Tax=Cudoniella acicularis TaxID=354080 RepID=A0A8H4RKJ3_9HELO|nr:hypothetical protein G7Y89_g7400 [Cudoniella acicularis]